MTKKEWDQWGRYIRHIANRLGLRDWYLFLDHKPADDCCTATIEAIEGRKHADIKKKKNWQDLSVDVQRHAIVHEMIHLHFISTKDIIRLDLLRHMSQSAYDVMWDGFKRQMEYGVDGLADAIAPLLPLPNIK